MSERLSELERWRIAELAAQGSTTRLIAKEIGRGSYAVAKHLRLMRRPPAREPVRSALRLSLGEREEISRGLVGGESLRAIARRLGRAPSTISREVAGNGGRRRYRACRAETAAVRRLRRPKSSKLATCPRLRAVVEAKLELRWSPQQISGWLVETFPVDPEMRVSHETIYLSLFVQSRGALRKELTRYLRSGHSTRRPRGYSVMNGQGQLRGDVEHSGATCRGQRSRGARPLGRRPADGQRDAGDRDAGGTQNPFRDAYRSSERSRSRRRRRRARCEDRRASRPAAPIVDLGPRQRDGGSREVQCEHWRAGLLL